MHSCEQKSKTTNHVFVIAIFRACFCTDLLVCCKNVTTERYKKNILYTERERVTTGAYSPCILCCSACRFTRIFCFERFSLLWPKFHNRWQHTCCRKIKKTVFLSPKSRCLVYIENECGTHNLAHCKIWSDFGSWFFETRILCLSFVGRRNFLT